MRNHPSGRAAPRAGHGPRGLLRVHHGRDARGQRTGADPRCGEPVGRRRRRRHRQPRRLDPRQDPRATAPGRPCMSSRQTQRPPASRSATATAPPTGRRSPRKTAAPTLGTGLDAEDFTLIARDDGTQQVAFYGHPVYYFKGDTAPNQTNGQGVGGKWSVVGADGNAIGAAASPAASEAASAAAGGAQGRPLRQRPRQDPRRRRQGQDALRLRGRTRAAQCVDLHRRLPGQLAPARFRRRADPRDRPRRRGLHHHRPRR